MLVQDPLSKYPRLGKYVLIFSIISGEFSEFVVERMITLFRLPNDETVAMAYRRY